MRRPAILITVPFIALLLVGCGSSSASSAQVDAVAKAMRTGSALTESQAQCIANSAVPKISDKARKELSKLNGDLTTLSKSDQKAVFDSFTNCLTLAQLSPTIAKAMGSNTSDARCFQTELEAHYKTSGEVMQALTERSTTFTAAVTACVSPSSLKKALADALTSSKEFTSAEANCIVDKIFANTSAQDLQKLESGSATSDLQSKVASYASQCADAK